MSDTNASLENPRPDAMDFIADGDPFDHFPWTVSLYSQEFQDLPAGHRKAFISTPNGKRIDTGEQHTYWSIASDLWEPTAVVIAKCVNAEAARRYGTPNPPSVYVDEWRTQQPFDQRPHSRACGVRRHEHGPDCHPNCPTCGGRHER